MFEKDCSLSENKQFSAVVDEMVMWLSKMLLAGKQWNISLPSKAVSSSPATHLQLTMYNLNKNLFKKMEQL